MTALTEGQKRSDFLVWEEVNHYSRDEVTILADAVLTEGMVVAKVTASGKYVQLDEDGADGSEAAAGIMLNSTAATGSDQAGVIIKREAIVIGDNLTWPATIEASEKLTALAELKALGILSREDV